MDGYLLDTNIVSYWFDAAKPEHSSVVQRISALPEGALLTLSVITLGEIEYGYRVDGPKPETEATFLAFIEKSLPVKFPVDRHTRHAYGTLRAALFNKFGPSVKKRKGLRPEELMDPATSRELGIQENDLWIAAQALQNNLVLVSHDKMLRIREVAEALRVEDWAE